MKPTLKLAHASDVHLDSDYYGGEKNIASRDACRKVFDDLLGRIVADQPDLFLLPGDLFDSNRPSEETIHWAMEKLGGLPFPVVMIPGNHDCLDPAGVYLNYDFNQIPNVTILLELEGQILRFEELQVNIWGRGMRDHTPDFRPLDGIPAPAAGHWNIGMGHGIYVGKHGAGFRSSPIEASQISESEFDYIALGHHHVLLNVSQNGTAAYYCGSPSPISDGSHGTWLSIQLEESEPPLVTINNLD